MSYNFTDKTHQERIFDKNRQILLILLFLSFSSFSNFLTKRIFKKIIQIQTSGDFADCTKRTKKRKESPVRYNDQGEG